MIVTYQTHVWYVKEKLLRMGSGVADREGWWSLPALEYHDRIDQVSIGLDFCSPALPQTWLIWGHRL